MRQNSFLSNAIILFALLLLFQGCASKKEDKICIGVLKGPSAISMAYLMEKPEEFGFHNVRFKLYNEPFQLRNAILRDEVDISTIPTIMASNLINNGKNLKIVAIPVWGTLHLYGEDSSVNTWHDLKNKEIYLMAQGLTPDILFRALLNANDIDPENDLKLNYKFQTHQELANASITGRAPLAVLSEPLVSMALNESTNLSRKLDLNKEWEKAFGDSLPLAQTALVVNFENALITKEWLNNFLSAYSDCCTYVNSHLDYSADFMEKHHILRNKSLAESAIPGCNIRFKKASDIKEGIINYINFFYQQDPRLTGGVPANNSMIYEGQEAD